MEKDDGTFAYTDIDKAEVLNNLFSSVSTREDASDIPEPGHTYDGETLDEFQVAKDDVVKKLIKLNPCKSPGPDSIHPRVMKETAEVVSHPLTIIFNKSLQLPRRESSRWLKGRPRPCYDNILKKRQAYFSW